MMKANDKGKMTGKVSNVKKRKVILTRTLFAVGVILCVIFGIITICNFIIIIKSKLDPDNPPKVFGVAIMVVMSGSMSGDAEDHLEVNDVIFVVDKDASELKKGDIIAFKYNSSIVTHRITEIEFDDDGKMIFTTKGDANNTADEPVHENFVIGIVAWRIPKLGELILFMQSFAGMMVVIAIICAFIIYEFVIRKKLSARRADAEANSQSDRADDHENSENDISDIDDRK